MSYKIIIKITLFCISLLNFYSCDSDTLPKPKSYLALKYPKATYHKISEKCPYDFEVSNQAVLNQKSNCWATVEYPKLKAKLYITYRKVDHNLLEILKEIEELTFKHTIKADAINSKQYENRLKKIYSVLYMVEGNVASNIQFRVTDSVKNVLGGALYFDVKPNYDSITPAINYIKKDVEHLIETLHWQE